jgi:uncharacterized membrane protein YdbT with pleckstrin-like domain
MSAHIQPARAGYVPEGERVILSIRPDAAYIVLAPMWTLAGLAGAVVAASWAAGRWPEQLGGWLSPTRAWAVGAALMLLVIGWHAADLACSRYLLTDRRVMRVRGIFRRSVVDAPLDKVQHIVLTRLLRERLTGLGSIGFATAGTAWVEVRWRMVSRSAERMQEVRRAIEDQRARGGS